jgi:hypothetical protein
MLLDKGGKHFTVGGYRSDSGFFVIAHEATVAFDISAEDCCEFTFKTLFCHNDTPIFQGFKQ